MLTCRSAGRHPAPRALAFLFVFLFGGNALARGETHHHDHDLRGTAFSNPAQLANVPADWKAQPVRYDTGHQDADLVVSLGQQTHPIFEKLLPEYAARHKIKIAVTQGTCGITAGRLLRKSVDVGAFCCPPGRSDRLPGLEFYTLGVSPIAILVHPENPLRNISLADARKLFQGKYSRWNETPTFADSPLGKQLIQPVSRLHCKVRPGHWRLLLNTEDQFSPKLYEVGVIPDMISQVANNPRAVGYEVPLMTVIHRKNGAVRMLSIDGKKPTDLEQVASGQYPFYRVYHLATWTRNPHAREQSLKLIAFMREYLETHYREVSFVPPSLLKKAGWKFHGDELVGEPDPSASVRR